MPLTKSSLPSFEELTGRPQVVHVASSESVSSGPAFASKENYGTTLAKLSVGSRVRVCGQPQTCGEVVRLMPMTGRVVVRLDPPHLAWRGTLRSFRPERLVIYLQGRGRVINLIGNDGIKPSYWEIAPGAANAAGQNLTLALAAQYGKEDISFVAVNPGPVRTERWVGLVDAMARDMKIPREEADMLAPRSIPLGRIAECEEVASLVTYLASDLAHFVNGAMIEIDGGQQKPLMDRLRDR